MPSKEVCAAFGQWTGRVQIEIYQIWFKDYEGKSSRNSCDFLQDLIGCTFNSLFVFHRSMRVMTPGRFARLAIAKWPCGSLHRMDAQGGSFRLRNEFVEDMFGSVRKGLPVCLNIWQNPIGWLGDLILLDQLWVNLKRSLVSTGDFAGNCPARF